VVSFGETFANGTGIERIGYACRRLGHGLAVDEVLALVPYQISEELANVDGTIVSP
jgi:hypothetical protein